MPILLRIDQRAQFDQVGDGVELDGVRLAAQAERLQAGGAAAHEGVQEARWAVGEGLADQVFGLLDGRGVAVFDLVPVHDGGDEVFQALALLVPPFHPPRLRGG